mmetsp:Transcript_46465/g.151179  ORF Transcript_46465/g.151179 Transcript_46465/m.151179 type:complete len:221 (-) Transcript_46465:89-751(-)
MLVVGDHTFCCVGLEQGTAGAAPASSSTSSPLTTPRHATATPRGEALRARGAREASLSRRVTTVAISIRDTTATPAARPTGSETWPEKNERRLGAGGSRGGGGGGVNGGEGGDAVAVCRFETRSWCSLTALANPSDCTACITSSVVTVACGAISTSKPEPVSRSLTSPGSTPAGSWSRSTASSALASKSRRCELAGSAVSRRSNTTTRCLGGGGGGEAIG